MALAVLVPTLALGPANTTLLPRILPDADSKPVIYSPVLANTATLLTPVTPTDMLALDAVTVTLELPELMLDALVLTPVRSDPLPNI